MFNNLQTLNFNNSSKNQMLTTFGPSNEISKFSNFGKKSLQNTQKLNLKGRNNFNGEESQNHSIMDEVEMTFGMIGSAMCTLSNASVRQSYAANQTFNSTFRQTFTKKFQ